MTFHRTALAGSLDRVVELLDREEPPYARLECTGGRIIHGELLDVGAADMIVLDDATGERTLLTAEIVAPDVGQPQHRLQLRARRPPGASLPGALAGRIIDADRRRPFPCPIATRAG